MPHPLDRCSILGFAALAVLCAGGCDNPGVGLLTDHTSAAGHVAASGPEAAAYKRPDQGAAAPLPEGQDLLAAAIESLEENEAVRASVRHETTLLGRRVVGRGVYLEQQASPWRRVRLELSTQMGEKAGSLVQLCDGRYLWTYDSLAPQPRVEKVDLARVAEALDDGRQPEDLVDLSTVPTFYGLPKLLKALSRRFAFGRAAPGRWGPARQPVWRVEGQWIAQQATVDTEHAADRGSSGAAPVRGPALPPLVPDTVVVLLDQQNLFPLRIEFRWTREAALGKDAAVVVDLFDVKLDVPIDSTRFSYSPGNLEVVDQTRQAIGRLRR